MAEVNINPSWKAALDTEFKKPYFADIKSFIVGERKKGKTVFPPGPLIFNAFNLTPFNQVKVVIIGQDPYHGKGQAHGLSFSVPRGVKAPPSLGNIYKELKADLGCPIPTHGNLEAWAKEGVLLLNAILTVNEGEPASHRAAGWEQFTNAVISLLSQEKSGLVFLLWGRYAQEKEVLIDENKHLILKAAHPSPFSADSGFFGCRHFSKANAFLSQPVNWKLPD
ncbi:MAG: uracil-DNA glycosylase [Chitinophagales bacterium]